MKLQNTQKLKRVTDMAPYTSAIRNFLYANNLPSFAYPEAYDFFVNQKNLKLVEIDGELELYFGDNFELVSKEEYFELCDTIREMENNGELFFQRKNKGVSEASRKIREARHALEVAEMEYEKLVKELDSIEV